MLLAVLVFDAIWILALVSWVAAIICYFRARRHYVGPTGILTLISPIARLKPSNYSAAGASLIRWEFRFILLFLSLVAIGTVIAHTILIGHGQ